MAENQHHDDGHHGDAHHAGGHEGDGHHGGGHHVNYKKIYFVLLGLLVVSVAGPFLEVLWITLITAFGIAIVKANLVIQNFMHLKWEKRLMKWMLATSLLLMALMMAGISPDVLNHEGNNWENVAAKAAVERGIDGDHGAEEEHAEEGGAAAPAEAGFSARTAFNNTCSSCHGAAGDGQGAAAAAYDPPPADFTDPEFWARVDDARMFQVIKEGGASVGASPMMAPWGAVYDDEQVQLLVEYVKTFRPEGAE